MQSEVLISLIEKEWDLDEGFFGRLRQGQFDQACFNRCLQTLELIKQEAANTETIPRRLVSLLWYIPLFMEWQRERIKESFPALEYGRSISALQTIVQGILGVP